MQVSPAGLELVQEPCVVQAERSASLPVSKSPPWLDHRAKWEAAGKVVWSGPLTASLGAFKHEFPGKEDSSGLGQGLSRISRVCSHLTNASRNHPAVLLSSSQVPRCSVSQTQQPRRKDVCFNDHGEAPRGGGVQRRALSSLGTTSTTGDVRGVVLESCQCRAFVRWAVGIQVASEVLQGRSQAPHLSVTCQLFWNKSLPE